jgi:hypothetical protein
MNLGFAGVLAAILAIGSSFGLVMACGLKFTTVVGVVPFLVTGMRLTRGNHALHQFNK